VGDHVGIPGVVLLPHVDICSALVRRIVLEVFSKETGNAGEEHFYKEAGVFYHVYDAR
jgi:hypothetical protein